MMIPITLRSTEEFLRAVTDALRGSRHGLGASKSKTIATVIVPAAYRGILTAVLLALPASAGETAPAPLPAFGQSLLEPGLESAHRRLSRDDYRYAISPL